MIKIFGSLLIIGATSFAGLNAMQKLNGRISFIESMMWFVEKLIAEIRYNATPVTEILEKMKQKGELPEVLKTCCDLCERGQPFPAAWRSGIHSGLKAFGLKESELSQLVELGSSLGATDTLGQIDCCALYREQLFSSLENAKQEKEKKGKMYITLGVLIGVAAVLVII